MKRTTIIETITILYVILFLYTGISKLLDYAVFKEQIASSEILSLIAKPLAFSLPLIEFVIVLLLIIPKWRIKGLYACAILMTIFTFYIVSILIFSKELPCSCGGIISKLSWGQHIVFNSIFIGMAILAIVLERKIVRLNQMQIATAIHA